MGLCEGNAEKVEGDGGEGGEEDGEDPFLAAVAVVWKWIYASELEIVSLRELVDGIPTDEAQQILTYLVDVEDEDATGLTQIVNQSGSASGRMDENVAELSGA
ncbi:unnamed protein product [Microthlaspi erraticum]|uniref:Uncharacterized protein n=1 Tax=Microthlaspi erraticum TaxID=1685480 RepID=A0A6D2HK48_9BRAS|nr:unnamed protein product [Microthlaspi erraticum]